MLFKPVYVKAKPKTTMHQAPIPMGNPRAPTPPPPPEPTPEPQQPPPPPVESPKRKLPILVTGLNGVKTVLPKEATRDVLSGRVAYYLVDDTGMKLFQPKHIFAALKLDKERQGKYEDYGCIGAHERQLEVREREKKREGLGYRRKYISPEVFHKGIFNEGSKITTLSYLSGPLRGGSSGPRA